MYAYSPVFGYSHLSKHHIKKSKPKILEYFDKFNNCNKLSNKIPSEFIDISNVSLQGTTVLNYRYCSSYGTIFVNIL